MGKEDTDTNFKTEFIRILRLKDVIDRTGLSRSGIYERMKNGGFPQNISLGGNSVGWVEVEVEEWISEKVREREWGDDYA